MAYDPNVETEKSLKALEKQIYKEYSRAYEEMSKTADQYFRTLEDRYKIEYEAYQRGAYTKQEFDLWYKTQIERGQGYNHMRDQLAGRMVEANKVASAYINDKTPSIYSLNYNHEAYRIEGAHPSARFDIYDEQTVKRLIEGGNAVEFKTVKPNPVRDYNWNKDQITSALMSGILQGKPIDKIADSFLTVMERNRTASMRNARTAYTSAQNAGRQESYRSAKRMGITMMKEWLATTDERTRASHGAMDGERVETDQTFSNELMYPADPDGSPEEVYNCRCTMFAVLPDINDEKRETYSDWIKRKEAEMSDKEAKSEKEKELKKAIERWNASHYSQPSTTQTAQPPFEYTPAKSIEEAENMMKQYVDESGWGALGVSYKGMSLDMANQVNETMLKFYHEYDVKKLNGVIAPTKNSRYGKLVSGAGAGYSPVTNNLLLNRDHFKNAKAFNEYIKGEQEAVKSFITNPERYNLDRMNSRVASVLKNSIESGRGNTAENVSDVLHHELGHFITKQIDVDQAVIESRMGQYASKISGYATDSYSEYIAESFASYQKGENRIDPMLREAFERLKR